MKLRILPAAVSNFRVATQATSALLLLLSALTSPSTVSAFAPALRPSLASTYVSLNVVTGPQGKAAASSEEDMELTCKVIMNHVDAVDEEINKPATAKKPKRFAKLASILSKKPMLSRSTDTDDKKAGSAVTLPNGPFSPVFDFSSKEAVDRFERIDDAIMGGISLSALRDVEGESYASWSGVCRTDGGGFCGVRTLPFIEPLNAGEGAEGVYVNCRFASDDEPERRVWKVTLRTDTSRGEMVYQAAFELPNKGDEASTLEGGDWNLVKVPFSEFKLVRGPRVVPDGPSLDPKGGIFQIGLSLSKFVIGTNTTQLENFRAGYFDLQIKQIGFYNGDAASALASPPKIDSAPQTLTKEEMQRKRPVLLKVLAPVAKLLFSEKANRRKSAMKILTEERGMSRSTAMLFGVRSRAGSFGLAQSVAQLVRIVVADSLRMVFRTALRICLFYPLRLAVKMVRLIKTVLGMKVKELPPME
mmetsp:Transcript_35310/g.105468  ORF Transcript_35310/g.105468 Transcript_35310/m.105468 type:complete len:474 (-) Transcript_35310:206-1627(-)